MYEEIKIVPIPEKFFTDCVSLRDHKERVRKLEEELRLLKLKNESLENIQSATNNINKTFEDYIKIAYGYSDEANKFMYCLNKASKGSEWLKILNKVILPVIGVKYPKHDDTYFDIEDILTSNPKERIEDVKN